MGPYAQLNSADDRTLDTAPAGLPPLTPNNHSPTSPTTKLHHRPTKSQRSNKLSTDGSDEDEGDWGFDDEEEEGIELMPTGESPRTLAPDPEEGEGRHVDEDEDVHSPAAMVRRVVPEHDDPTMSALTFRVFLLGSLLCVFGASVSQLFFFKSNAPSFSSFFIILLSLPMGRLAAATFPEAVNPGPFTKKEHVLTSILASSGASAAYAGEIISVQSLYYHVNLGAFGGLLLLLTTQLIGFGLSGLTYKVLVRPTAMVWPFTLVIVSMFETLHGSTKEHVKEGKERMRAFSVTFTSIFSWQMLPSLVFPGLSSIALLCLVDNRNWILTTLGSGYEGFGMFNLSLDWSVIGGTGAMYTPWAAACCFYLGLVVNMWIITPLLYFSNWWDSLSFDSPMAAHLYNSTAGRMDVLELLTPTLSLNETRYAEIGPIRLTPYFALSYGISFAVLTSAIVSVLIWSWSDIKDAFLSKEGSGDIHVQMLERSYDDVPGTWYAVCFGSCFVGACALLTFWPLQMGIPGLMLALAMGTVFLVPIGTIAAVSGTTLGLNVATEFLAGYIWEGEPINNILFKVYGYMCLVQSLDLSADQKLGLYMKLPPRHLFIVQVWGTALGSIVNHSLIEGIIASKRPYLDGTIVDPTGQWSGRKPEIFFSASVIWGLIAPARFFSGKYLLLYLGFPIGALLPLVPWVLHKRALRANPKSTFWKQVSVPLILHGSIIAPQTPLNVIIPGFVAAFLSQYYALRYHTKWADKYLYTIASALDAGTSVNAIFLYVFGLSTFATWWGNSSIDTEHCRPGS